MRTRWLAMAHTVACLLVATAAQAADSTPREGLDRWRFVIGEWDLIENRFGFDSKPIGTSTGHASFSHTMRGQRIQELQTVVKGADTTTALHLFVYDPRSKEVEIARTDSGHYGFWVIVGTLSEGRMDLKERDPDPSAEVTRRITYRRADDDHFTRHLEFSVDHGETWFVRSEWSYTRRR